MTVAILELIVICTESFIAIRIVPSSVTLLSVLNWPENKLHGIGIRRLT